jgi:mannose-1-phosphate guanylyltransferase
MNAAILAAGLGTRLRPLTLSAPKALAPILNRPLLGILLAQLKEAGAAAVAVNTHHLAGQVHDFLDRESPSKVQVLIRHEPEILGTGGGLRGLAQLLGEGPFLAMNSDILTDLDLAGIFSRHHKDAVGTLVLHDCPPFNNVWTDGRGHVAGIGQEAAGASGPPLAYTGVQVVGESILEFLPAQGPADLVAAWRQAMAAGGRLDAAVVKGHFWQEVGSPAAYLEAHRRLQDGEGGALRRFFPEIADPLLGSGAVLEEGAACGGCVCLGANVRVGRGAILAHTVVWEGAVIAPGVSLERCIVGQGVQVSRSARDAVLT